MKKKSLLTLAIIAALTLSLSACSEAAQTENRLKTDVLSGSGSLSEFAAHFKETDDKLRYFVSMNGIVYSERDFKKAIEDTAFDPGTLATLDPDTALHYKASPDAGTSRKPADDERFYHNQKGAEITYGQYKKLLDAFRPVEIDVLDSELIELLCTEQALDATLETSGGENQRNVLELGGKRIIYLSQTKTYDETKDGKVSISFEAGNIISVTGFCEITKNGTRETKLFDGQSNELHADGNIFTLEYDAGSFDLADYGIIAVCEK